MCAPARAAPSSMRPRPKTRATATRSSRPWGRRGLACGVTAPDRRGGGPRRVALPLSKRRIPLRGRARTGVGPEKPPRPDPSGGEPGYPPTGRRLVGKACNTGIGPPG
jgi:hypothetical protein